MEKKSVLSAAVGKGKLKLGSSSQDVSDALRNTLTIIFPFVLFFYLGRPSLAIGIGTGTLLICLTDLPGSKSEKLFGAWSSITIFALIATATAYCLGSQLLPLVIALQTFLLIMLSSINQRLAVIGMMGMVVATFTIGLRPISPLEYGLFMAIGGIWYYVVSLIQVWLFPYHALKRALYTTRILTVELMELRAKGYDVQASLSGFNARNIKLHVKLTANHELIRRLLLNSTKASQSDNDQVRKLLHQGLVLIDLYEQVSAVHFDYANLRKRLANSGALKMVSEAILLLSAQAKGCSGERLRVTQLIDNLESLTISSGENNELLKSIIANLKATAVLVYNLDGRSVNEELKVRQFKHLLSEKEISMKPVWTNMRFDSPIFRFAIRMSALMFVAVFTISSLPEHSYGYWLPLTLIVVCRPSYGLTLKRNIERISGTLLGLSLGWALIGLELSVPLLLLISVVSLFVFFAFFFGRYWVSALGITLAVVLCLSIYHGNAAQILSERLLFTVIGCAIGLAATFLFPIRHEQQINLSLKNVLSTNKSYLESVVGIGTAELEIKLARKQSYLALSALNDALSQGEREPRWNRRDYAGLRQIELLCFQLNALIAGIPSKSFVQTNPEESYRTVVDDLDFCLNHVGLDRPITIFKLDATALVQEQSLALVTISRKLKSYFTYVNNLRAGS
jgi:uncharacterized membrane protein YccC